MRIAHSIMHYWPAISGSEEYIRNISEQLVKKSYDVTVLTSSNVRRKHEETLNGVKIRKYPTIHLQRMFNVLRRLFHNLRDPFSGMMSTLAYGFTPSIYFDIIKNRYDLVHATPIPANNVVLSFLAAKKARIPFVCTPLFHYRMKEYYNKLYINMLKKADGVLVCTRTEGRVLNRLGIDENRIHQITLGIDIEAWKSTNPREFRRRHGMSSSPMVLFGARKTKEKGAFFVLEAMKKVWKQNPDVYLVAMGDRRRDWLTHLSNLSNQESKRVIDLDWPGASNRQEKMAAFAACDVFVMPSIIDAFGLVYLESWICNRPVIAADTPVMREVVSRGRDGLLVEFGNTSNLARAIIKLLEDDNLRKKMGAYGRAKVLRRHGWTLASNEIAALYEAITNRS